MHSPDYVGWENQSVGKVLMAFLYVQFILLHVSSQGALSVDYCCRLLWHPVSSLPVCVASCPLPPYMHFCSLAFSQEESSPFTI